MLKGKTQALALWEPLHDGVFSGEFLHDYAVAYARLGAGQPDAAALFAQLLEAWPDDPCVKLHAARLGQGLTGAELVMAEK